MENVARWMASSFFLPLLLRASSSPISHFLHAWRFLLTFSPRSIHHFGGTHTKYGVFNHIFFLEDTQEI